MTTTANRTEIVLAAIRLERARQDTLIDEENILWDLTDLLVDDLTKLGVLMEEVGEVARELNEDKNDLQRIKNLYIELIQVAAVCAGWAESIHELREVIQEAEQETRDERKVRARTPVGVAEGTRGTGS